MRPLLACLAVALCAACSPDTSTIGSHPRVDGGNGSGDAGSGNGGDGGSTGAGNDGGGTPGGDGGDGCSDQAKLVYVIDANSNILSSFHAGPAPTFQDIGAINCPAQFGAQPFSMSVDRTAIAWVLYSSGELFKVDTSTAACSATTFQPQQGFSNFGMGFVANSAGASVDSLFIANSGALATLDTASLQVAKVGNLSGQPELTGTGDAKLYGFYPDPTNPRVSLLDKANGNEGTSYPLQPLAGTPNDWAFAFWGGDFWIFLKRDSDNSTNVWHLVPSTQTVTKVLNNTGRHIVGAGVSTCAPISPQ